MSFEVEAHGAGRLLGGDVFDDGVFVRGILVDDREITVAAGGKDVTGRRIEAGSIWAFTDGGIGDDFAGIHVHHRHHLLVADGKSAAIFDVHREAGR